MMVHGTGRIFYYFLQSGSAAQAKRRRGPTVAAGRCPGVSGKEVVCCTPPGFSGVGWLTAAQLMGSLCGAVCLLAWPLSAAGAASGFLHSPMPHCFSWGSARSCAAACDVPAALSALLDMVDSRPDASPEDGRLGSSGRP